MFETIVIPGKHTLIGKPPGEYDISDCKASHYAALQQGMLGGLQWQHRLVTCEQLCHCRQWVIEAGRYELEIGASAADIKVTLPLELKAGNKPRTVYTMNSVIGEIIRDPRGLAVMDFMISQRAGTPVSMADGDPFFTAILKNLPFKRIANFSQGAVNEQQLMGLLMMVNSDMTAEQVKGSLSQYAPPPADEPE